MIYKLAIFNASCSGENTRSFFSFSGIADLNFLSIGLIFFTIWTTYYATFVNSNEFIMKDIQVRSVSEFNNELKLKGFNVFQIESDSQATRSYSRKDFYKICLTTGTSAIHY